MLSEGFHKRSACHALILPAILFSIALSGADRPKRPQAVFSASTCDFGIVERGKVVTCAITIKNQGNAPLKIEKVEFSDAKMTGRIPAEVLPGKEGKLEVEWDTIRVTGEATAGATVVSNDPAQPRAVLTFKINAKSPIEFLPIPAVFLSVFKGDNGERTLTIVNNSNQPLTIDKLEADSKLYTASVKDVVTGKKYELIVKAQPTAPAGLYREYLYLDTNFPRFARIRIPINLLVKNEVYVNPPAVDFGRVSLADIRKNPRLLTLLIQTFLVKKREGKDFEVTKVRTDVGVISIKQDPPSGKSPTYAFDVSLQPELLRPEKIQGSIVIETNDPQFPHLKVPVRGEFY
jgi:hypothetical protein